MNVDQLPDLVLLKHEDSNPYFSPQLAVSLMISVWKFERLLILKAGANIQPFFFNHQNFFNKIFGLFLKGFLNQILHEHRSP